MGITFHWVQQHSEGLFTLEMVNPGSL